MPVDTVRAGSVAEYTAEEGMLDSGSTVAVWPVAYGDFEVDRYADRDEVDRVYFANGTGDVPRLHEVEDGHPKFEALDVTYGTDAPKADVDDIFPDGERPDGVLSYDLPAMIDEGLLDPLDVEVARDPAMSVFHNPEYARRQERFRSEGTDDAAEAVHSIFDSIMQRNADTSAAMLADGGVAVYATNDFGMAARDPVLEASTDGIAEKRAAYEEVLIETLGDRFDDVIVAENTGEIEPIERDQRYVVAHDPR